MSACVWESTEPKPYRERLPTDVVVDLLIDEYEIRCGDLSDRCKKHLHNVVFVSRGERIYEDCDFALGAEGLKGEHLYDGASYIWIKKSLTPMQYNGVLAHELIHSLLACESDPTGVGVGDGDEDHNRPDTWCTTGYGCKWDGNDNEDSLEYAVAETVRYYRKEGEQ